MDLFIN